MNETTAERREFWAMIENLLRSGRKAEADERIAQRKKMLKALDSINAVE
jgi:hypothetical protein